MANDDIFTITYTFTAHPGEGGWFVIEQSKEPNTPAVKYGPMPRAAVEAFVADRKEQISEMVTATYRRLLERPTNGE